MSEIKIYKNNNLIIRYAVLGCGAKPFIMLPGISLKPVVNAADIVESAFQLFSKDYKIYLIDRKDNIEYGYSVEDMAKDTIELLDFLKIDKAFFFGASQGGMILQKIAYDRPDIIKKAVFASSAMYTDDEHKKVFNSWIEKGKMGNPEILNRDMWDKIYDKEYFDRYKETFEKIATDATPYEMKKVSILSEACNNFDSRAYINKINCESLVVGGELDKVFGAEASKDLARALDSEIYIYKNYGHALYDEAPDFKKKMYDFMV